MSQAGCRPCNNSCKLEAHCLKRRHLGWIDDKFSLVEFWKRARYRLNAHGAKTQADWRITEHSNIFSSSDYSVSSSNIKTPTCATFLQTHLLQNLFEFGVLRDKRDLDVDSSAHSRAEITRAGQDVAEVGIPHEFISVLLHMFLHLAQTSRLI